MQRTAETRERVRGHFVRHTAFCLCVDVHRKMPLKVRKNSEEIWWLFSFYQIGVFHQCNTHKLLRATYGAP